MLIQINSCSVFDALFSIFFRIDLTNQIFSKSEWFRYFDNLINWDFYSCLFSTTFSESLRIYLLVIIFVLIKNSFRFSRSFFVSKRVLSVIVWDFILLIKIDRSVTKRWQFSTKCCGFWVKLQFSLHFFVS